MKIQAKKRVLYGLGLEQVNIKGKLDKSMHEFNVLNKCLIELQNKKNIDRTHLNEEKKVNTNIRVKSNEKKELNEAYNKIGIEITVITEELRKSRDMQV